MSETAEAAAPSAIPIVMDGRMLVDARTGVATYAQSLRAAISSLSTRPGLVVDRAISDMFPPQPFGRWGRIARALWPFARSARPSPCPEGEVHHRVPDVFRLAQVFFDIHGRTMPIRLSGPPGIAHWSYPLPLHIAGWTNVYTIHDLIPLTHPGMSEIDPVRYRKLLEAVKKAATGIATVSEASCRDIAAALGSPALPVIDCGQPVNVIGSFGPLPDGLVPHGYLLVLGSIEKRKNIPAIVAAYRAAGIALPLVIAGPDGWNAASIADAASGDGVIRLPYLPADVIRSLIARARGLIMASLAEGFGLPVAEAMALGTPVLTSNCGALAETAGNAALLADPMDVAAIAAAIKWLANDDALCERLRAAGLERATTFAPARFAQRLRDFYASLPAMPPR